MQRLGARARLRNARDRWIDQTLVTVGRAGSALAGGGVDVLVLAESSCLAYAYADSDTTRLPELLARRSGRKVVSVAGAGYDARMYDRVLAALWELPRPRALVVSVNVRTNVSTGVTAHPVHGHARSLAALERITPISGRVWPVGRGGSAWTEREIRAFRTLPITTRWGGVSTTGAHLDRLEGQGPPPWPIELERRRFDYFHGEMVGPDHPALASLSGFGERLAAYGVPVVAYWATPPVEHGEGLFPGEFAGHVAANLAKVEGALDLSGRGFAPLLRPRLGEADFQDARNGTEHYAYAGRLAVASAVAESLAAVFC